MDNEIPINKEVTYFAKTDFRNSNTVFGIKRKDRRQHMYVLGKSGTGKSVLLSNLIIQNIKNGEGVCVVDPHGELVEEILNFIPEERAKDVVYFNPADRDHHIGFNVIQINDPKHKHLVASGLMGIFTKIWANAWSARMEYILNNTILALLDTPDSTLLGIPRLLVDKDYRQMVISNLKDPVVKSFWTNEYEQWRDQFRNEAIAPIQNKVGQFLSSSIIRNVVGQAESTINVFDIMNEGKIFLVNVAKGRIGEDNSALLGGMIITKIQLAAMERVRIPEDRRRDFYLYVDEFQNFATDSFADILSEARKYRLNLIVAHQYTAQLTNAENNKVKDAVFGNVGTMIIFRVGADDADFLEKEFSPEFTAQDLVNLPNYHIYLKLMIDGVTSRPFSAITLPPMKVDPTKGIKDRIIECSRELYTKRREDVEREIDEWSNTLQVSKQEKKHKAECTNCNKPFFVPFKPEKGRPVYCQDCLAKAREGKISTPDKRNASSASQKKIEREKTVKYTENNKESSSSPRTPEKLGLKELLEKIKEEEEKGTIKEVKKVKAKKQTEAISLSELKSGTKKKNKDDRPTKEISEESRGDLLNSIARSGIIYGKAPSRDREKSGPKKERETEKKEPDIVSKDKILPNSQKTDSTPGSSLKKAEKEDINIINNNSKKETDASWQKPRAKREVPEEVLRKILE